MHDARDAEDTRLLEARRHAELLAVYWPVVVDRLRLRLPDREAHEVASDVADRLLSELAAGKTYAVPFRVVVHNVIKWKLKEHFRGTDVVLLPEEWDAEAPDAFADWEAEYDFGAWLAPLPERQRTAVWLRYVDGLEVAEVAERLEIEPNAGDQLLWRAREKLKQLAVG